MVDHYYLASEFGGTMEPQASMSALTPAGIRISLVPRNGSTGAGIRGTEGTRHYGLEIGICMQAHSHSLVMIVVKKGA